MSKTIEFATKRIARKMFGLFLITIMFVTVAFPNSITAEQNVPKKRYFVVEKKWENDVESERPKSINIHIVGSDGYTKNDTLTSDGGWKKSYSLPAYDTDNKPITYYVYEDELADYIVSNGENNKLTIKSIEIEDNSERAVVNSPYTVVDNTDSFNNAPKGNIKIDTDLKLSEAKRELSDGFSYSTETPKYANPFDKNDSQATNVVPRILYTGTLAAGENSISGEIKLTWERKAVDYLTGQEYDVQIIVNKIKIYSEVEASNKTIAIMSNVGGYLEMESFVTAFSTNIYENVVGVGADVEIKVLNAPEKSFTQVYITDLDVGDYASGYNYALTNSISDPETCITHKITDGYAEAVELLSGVASDIYVTSDTRLINNNKRFLDGTGSVDVNSSRNSLRFVASANSYKYRWTGSKCETAIIATNPSTVPSAQDYTNELTNSSAVYLVKTFYMDDKGEYDTSKPYSVSSMRIKKPGQDVTVTDDDKTSKQSGYTLDERKDDSIDYTKKWTGTVTEDNTLENPLVLEVYFKKTYTVIYHDNVKEIVWKAADQTNPNLDYGVPTPGYDTDKETKAIEPGDPKRAGYNFLGWSETETGKIITIPEKVTKNADYWAHWEARTDTKYKVEYYYEKDGSYPSAPNYTSPDRFGTTDTTVSVTSDDKIPVLEDYYLNSSMDVKWTGIVAGDGSLILKVYFREKTKPATHTYVAPMTGIE